jgi:hypothetical protein
VTTPGTCQNAFSAPQKQPIATYSTRVPSGHGPSSGVPRTACVAGTSNGRRSRPGSASAGATIVVFSLLPKII